MRHRLASVFDPQSVLVIIDTSLPLCDSLPERIKKNSHIVRIPANIEENSFVEDIEKLETLNSIDLAVVCVRESHLSLTVELLSKIVPKSLLVLASNEFEEPNSENYGYLYRWAKQHQVLFIGPRSYGIQRPHINLNLTRSSEMSRSGKVAVVSQSRMIMSSVMDWAQDVNVGVSLAVSLGEIIDIDLPEIIEFLAADRQTDSIVLYLDKLTSGRKLLSAIRMASSVKPVVLLRAGRHSKELPGLDIVFDSAMRRAGAVRVNFFVELFAALKALTYAKRPKGGRIAILSNGRGMANLTADAMGPHHVLSLAQLSVSTQQALEKLLGEGGISSNPVVSYAPFDADRMQRALQLLVEDPNVDTVMVMLTPDELCDMEALVEVLAKSSHKLSKPVISGFVGEAKMRSLRRQLDAAGTPAFRTPETAVGAVQALTDYHYNQQLLQQLRTHMGRVSVPNINTARQKLYSAINQGKNILQGDEAIAIFEEFFPKVSWNVDPKDEAFSVEDNLPPVQITVRQDAIFGPWIHFASANDVGLSRRDKGTDLPPLNNYLANQLILRSRVWQQELASFSEMHHLDQLRELIEVVSDMICELPEIEAIDLKPIILGAKFLHVHGVKICLGSAKQRPRENGYQHMAIYPYPSHLVEHYQFKDGKEWTLRPIRPEDADALQTFVRGLSENSRYMRFVSMMQELTPKMLTRYTYIDYFKELALVATIQKPNPENRGHLQDVIIGMAHYLLNPDGIGAEYALVVGDEWQRQGLGRVLMMKLFDEARAQGLQYIEGLVLAKNKPMQALMTSLGLRNDPDEEDEAMRRIWMPL